MDAGGNLNFVPNGGATSTTAMIIGDEYGNVGIGTTTEPEAKLHVRNGVFRLDQDGQYFDLKVDASGNLNFVSNNTNTTMYIDDDTGAVGIGTTNLPANYLLAVDGKVIAEEVRVELSGDWPDYVFQPGHQLPTLSEVKAFTQANQHLPGIPSASEVKEKGLHLGEMQTKMLEKLEELYLHVIQMSERVEALEKENVALRHQLDEKK